MAPTPPDPTFHATSPLSTDVPSEELAYVALQSVGGDGRPDALGVVDTNEGSASYGQLVGRMEFPNVERELHHVAWNACSSRHCSCTPNARATRRYLIAPGVRSSRIHIVDTHPDPRRPRLVKVIEGDEVARRTGYVMPHAVRCGPDGIYVNALGAVDGGGPGGIFVLDHETFAMQGAWERDRGPQYLAYTLAWHRAQGTLVTSEWGTPDMVRNGLVPELLFDRKYGHALHVWDLRERRHIKAIDFGAEHQMVLELRPAHNPTRAYGFAGVALSLIDLSSSVFLWYLDRSNGNGTGEWKARKVIRIPAEPADPALLPPVLVGSAAIPPFIGAINLSVDDRFLYVSCWGTGELRQYDVSDPFNPVLTAMVRLGGIVRRAPHPREPRAPLNGGPHAVEVSRDGRRVYVTNALHASWDAQFYPEGIRGWLAKFDVGRGGGLVFDPRFFVEFEDGIRPHQVRLLGGDATG